MYKCRKPWIDRRALTGSHVVKLGILHSRRINTPRFLTTLSNVHVSTIQSKPNLLCAPTGAAFVNSECIPSVSDVVVTQRINKRNDIVVSPLKHISIVGELFKWKLSVWIALSTLPGYIMSSSATPMFPVFAALACGTFLCSGGANAFNQLLERDRDALMIRTRTRPLSSGRITPGTGMVIGVSGSVLGFGILWFGTNPVTACIGAFNIGLYTLAYTPLKIITPYNVHVGSIVGSIPTIMGCTAAGASLLTPDPWMLFIIQGLWQFPHFYGLAWRHRLDYLNGGFKSFPLSDNTGHLTAKLMEPHLLATLAFPFITTSIGLTNAMFIIDGSCFNYFLWSSFKNFQNQPSTQTARKFFFISLWHLLITLSLAVFHSRCLRNAPVVSTEVSTTRIQQDSFNNLHSRIQTLRESVKEFCLHKQFDGLNYPKEFCFSDQIAKLPMRFSER